MARAFEPRFRDNEADMKNQKDKKNSKGSFFHSAVSL
jgi:hypothetical protein